MFFLTITFILIIFFREENANFQRKKRYDLWKKTKMSYSNQLLRNNGRHQFQFFQNERQINKKKISYSDYQISKQIFNQNLKLSMESKMKCLVLEKYDGNLKYTELPIPPLKKGQVLIKIEATTVNPSDQAFIIGQYGFKKELPNVPGFECSGKVIKSGGGFQAWRLVGKKVACFSTERYGTWSEYLVTNANNCFALDESISYEKGACSLVNPLTVLCFERIIIKTQPKAVMHTAACSNLGKMLIKTCNKLNIPIINIVRGADHVETLKKMNCQHIIDQTDKDFVKKLKELAKSLEATLCFEAICGEMTGIVYNCMPPKSTIYVYGGLSAKPASGFYPLELVFKNKKLLGFHLNSYLKEWSTWELLSLNKKLNNGLKSELDTNIAKEFSLDQYKEAFAFNEKNRSSQGKIIFKPRL